MQDRRAAPVNLELGRGALRPHHPENTEPVWSLFYGSRWAVSTTKGKAGINGPFVDVACIDPDLQRPSHFLANVSCRLGVH